MGVEGHLVRPLSWKVEAEAASLVSWSSCPNGNELVTPTKTAPVIIMPCTDTTASKLFSPPPPLVLQSASEVFLTRKPGQVYPPWPEREPQTHTSTQTDVVKHIRCRGHERGDNSGKRIFFPKKKGFLFGVPRLSKYWSLRTSWAHH